MNTNDYSVKRSIQPCSCNLQHKYGYEIWKRGKQTYWETVYIGTLSQCLEYAKNIPQVLIACRGCGQELLREY